jgi:hypothetical protein
VYRLRLDVNRCRSLEAEGEGEDLFALWFGGRPTSVSEWVPPAFAIADLELQEPDIWSATGFEGVVVEERLTPLIEEIGVEGQFLPITVPGRRFRALNITALVDCLDGGASYPPGRAHGGIPREYVFVRERVPNTPLFKIPQTAAGEVLCVESDETAGFKGLVEAHELTGVIFDPLWSSTEGPLGPGLRLTL